ncbi:MAG: hypothetical protein IPG17_20395 [Sandaracinaceae bacterium]|nr:hypothetical protein [Sandaracinaceae bacterium]
MFRPAIAALLAASFFVVGYQRPLLTNALTASLAPEDVYYLPADTRMLELLTLQYREAIADILWMKALLYYTEHLTNHSAAEYAMRYGEALIALDPDFVEIYRWAGTVPFYLTVETPLEMRRTGTRLLVQGSDRMPDNGALAWDAAATVTYELLPYIPADDPTRGSLEADSERLLARAVHLGAGPAWLSLNSASASVRLGRTEVAVRNLERALTLTDDPALRVQIMARLSDLSASTRRFEIQAEHRRLAEARQLAFPYLSADEFLVFGERRLPLEDAQHERPHAEAP